MKRLEHPYQDLATGQWLRGNLHTHTDRSDGCRPPQEVIDDYAARGYDFLMLSDHDRLTPPQEFDPRGMLLIPGNEISAKGPHLLHVNAPGVLTPHPRRQQVINEAADDGRGFIIVNHPNWYAGFNHCTLEQLQEWVGYSGIEIYNGTIGRLDGSPYATNKWDMLLAGGRRVWGYANDDSHKLREDVELGWNVALARQRTLEGVLQALRGGRFYASTGVTITGIHIDGMRVRIETADAERIVALRNVARRFAVSDGPVMEVEVPPEATYVRFECWGRGERYAWTQPMFVVDED